MSDFPEPTPFNGADMREMGAANRQDSRWKCLQCPAAGTGYISRGRHWYATQHHIVAGFDPRATHAPRESRDPEPEQFCLPNDGTGRR